MKRVLVFRCENLLAAGVESLLAREHDLLVLGVTNNRDDLGMIQEIEYFHPNVVILDESALVADFSNIYGILKKQPKIRFIIVDEGENVVHIIDKQVMLVGQSADFIELIRIDQNGSVAAE